MSQLIEIRPKREFLIQEIVSSDTNSSMVSSVSKATCQICGKGLENGFSLSFKETPLGTKLLCEFHY